MHQHGIIFRHADRVTVDINRAYTASGKYTMAFGDGHHFDCGPTRSLEMNTASDGVHITGPAQHIAIGNVSGVLGDDSVSLAPGDHSATYGTGGGDIQGPIHGVTVRKVTRRTPAPPLPAPA